MAPPGASPLPKAELVRKKGYVLSRISFRTIVMKKWKQSFWVQYGPHTMLWFRSEDDFKDWLNNPYHDQAARNFLIKLAVNFVHDLYKPNVRGYQVTQCRTKAYGNKMIRQFKLERWMDYGPTIAAAFGSYDPKEVDDLREALVECMRNTPLNSGIRATGAVRQGQGQHDDRSRGKSTTFVLDLPCHTSKNSYSLAQTMKKAVMDVAMREVTMSGRMVTPRRMAIRPLRQENRLRKRLTFLTLTTGMTSPHHMQRSSSLMVLVRQEATLTPPLSSIRLDRLASKTRWSPWRMLHRHILVRRSCPRIS